MYFTGTVGGDYDVAPYDAAPSDLATLAAITEQAWKHGRQPVIRDVLDLGCGFGRQLAEAAPHVIGRLVGVDASQASCDGARRILGSWSDRAEIIQADIATLEPSRLGQFDLIFCIGTLYTMPLPARTALLATIRSCLRPGGLLIVSYYAGTNAMIKVAVAKYLRSLQQAGNLAEAIDAARQHVAFAREFKSPSAIDAVHKKLAEIARADNTVLAHEILGHGITVQNTAVLASELGPAGIIFLSYMGYDPANFAGEAGSRLFLAETLDLLEGGYRYALFSREAG